MAPLFTLLILFSLLYAANRFRLLNLNLPLIGLIPVSILLIIAGIAHFIYEKTMVAMMPEFLPFKLELVYITGVLELLAAIGLLLQRYRKLTVILLILFLLAVLPANIIGSMKKLPVGGMDKGIAYLYFRIPLQFFFMWWVYYFGILKSREEMERGVVSNRL